MTISNSSSLAETTLIACAAAAVTTWIICKWTLNSGTSTSTSTSTNSGRDDLQHHPSNHSSCLCSVPYKVHTVAARSQHDTATMLANGSQAQLKAKSMNPLQILQSLQQGNARFWTGQATRPEVSAFERRAMIQHQFPSTAVLGCADARVPVEIVLDQGLGDLFVVRVAGNCLGPTTQASLEYAIFHLDVKVVLIMGHQGCGAIKAAQLPLPVIQQETENLALVLQQIKAGLLHDGNDHVSQIIDARAKDRELGAMNVRNQVERLTQDVQILERVNQGQLIIVGAYYEISSGIVDFLMQVSMPDPDMKPAAGVQSRFNPITKELVYA